MRKMAAVLALTIAVSGTAQQAVLLSAKAEAVRQKVESFAQGTKISVVPKVGDEEFGKLLSHDARALTFYDVDEKRSVSFSYEELKKVKRGYAGYNAFTGRHVDRKKEAIAVGAVAGALVLVIVLAATQLGKS